METSVETRTTGGRAVSAPRAFPREDIRERPHSAVQYRAQPQSDMPGETLANFLGWFSVGLGLAQLASPGGMARLVGVSDSSRNRSLMRALGLRELASGLGILTQPKPTAWLQSRVAGDMMDLALLGNALTSDENARGRTVFATVAVLGVTALDVICSKELAAAPAPAKGVSPGTREVRRTITVNRDIAEVYTFWRDFENLPRFMRHLESVTVMDDGRSHWKAKAPAGKTVEWDAEITDDRPNERIAWRSTDNADVYNEGWVEFQQAPGGRGTIVRVDITYRPPGGKIGAQLAKLFREEPGQQIGDDLRAFKQVIELGEVVISDATVRRGLRPARPPE